MAVRPNFPLPKGYFGAVNLTKEQEERYRDIVRKRLETALAEEYDFAVMRKRQVDANKWKLYKSKNQLHTYKRRATTVVLGEHKHGSMLCVGRIEGTLEDMIYGTYDKGHEEMKVSMKYIDTTTKDCTVLHTIDLATPTDPFHYLGLKYFVTKFPGGFVIKDRDWPYLEACGIEHDSTGRRYGYLIFHAVNLPNVPAFDRADVVRGQLFFTFLFRETDGGFIDIFSQGYFDPAGDVIASFSAIMTQETLMVVSKAPKCAEAKKLTILALTAFSDKSQFSQHRCSVCTSTGGLFSSLRVCRICSATVCSKCRVKKFIFAGRNHAILNISCCPPCVLKAKTMSVRPAEDAFSVLAEKHLPEELFRSESSQFSDPPEVPTPRDVLEDKSTVCGGDSDDDDERYNQSVSSTMSEDEMEGMIEMMMRQKLQTSNSTSSRRGNEIDPRVLLEGGEQTFVTPRSTPRSHVPQYDNGGAFFPPQQPAGMNGHMNGPPLPMQQQPVRSTSMHAGEFEFRNLNHHPQAGAGVGPTYHHQPQYAPVPSPQYQQQQQQTYLHPADVRNMKATDYIAMGSQYHTEFRNLHHANPNPRDNNFRSPSEFAPAVARVPSQLHSPYEFHHQPSSAGPSDDFRGGGVPLAVPSGSSQQQMPQMPPAALDYRNSAPQHIAAARPAAMGPPQPGMAPHQAELFHKMVALQNSAQQVYAITKQNEEYMRNLHT